MKFVLVGSLVKMRNAIMMSVGIVETANYEGESATSKTIRHFGGTVCLYILLMMGCLLERSGWPAAVPFPWFCVK